MKARHYMIKQWPDNDQWELKKKLYGHELVAIDEARKLSDQNPGTEFEVICVEESIVNRYLNGRATMVKKGSL